MDASMAVHLVGSSVVYLAGKMVVMLVDELGACSVEHSVVTLAWCWVDGMVVMWVVQTD